MTKQKETAMQPLGDRVVILPDASEEMATRSGILMPGQETNITGTVVSVGPGRTLDSGENLATFVQPGDHVLLGKFGHDDVVYAGVKYIIINEPMILAILA
jgi:chaperonin GroES